MRSATTHRSVGGNARATSATAQRAWTWEVKDRTFLLAFRSPHRVLSWAPLNGGLKTARVILNHQVDHDDRDATRAPRAFLTRLSRSIGRAPGDIVAMMTSADVTRVATAEARRADLLAAAWCTAGTSNALRVGDPASVERAHAGTINLIVALNRALSAAGLAEAIQIAVEARVLAVQASGIASVRSGLPATGTGTDCIAVAAPVRGRTEEWCGKHTRLGELIGTAALRGCALALAQRGR